jgi:hypothetical protein
MGLYIHSLSKSSLTAHHNRAKVVVQAIYKKVLVTSSRTAFTRKKNIHTEAKMAIASNAQSDQVARLRLANL